MIPILFEGTETQFTSNGIGRLSDAISCFVTENRNGAYELEMKYPIDGIHFSDIQLGRYIFAKPAKYSNNQAFEIYQITRPINGVCTICAYHISYRLAKIPVMPNSTNSISTALNNLVTYAAETNPFTFTTTKTTVANYKLDEPRDARSCLGGVQGSILDVFGGGDYEFDMFSVKLWANRGQDRGFQIRYGKNLTNIKQEESIENTITGICPFYKNDSTTVTLTEKVIETASASNFPYPRTVPVDLSSYFEDKVPTEAELRAKANAYIESHSIGVPKVSLDVSFVNLADMPGYEDIAVLEDIRLCDTVKVVFEKLGVSASAKVISTEYDTLKERFTKVGLGTPSTSLANTIAELDKKTEQQTSVVQSAIDRATNLITGVSGGYVVIHQDEDGKPYEILIMDNEDINSAQKVWRWNQAGWGYSSNGYNGTYALAATIDGEIVADFIKAGVLTGIEINNGNGTFHVDENGVLTANSGTFSGNITSAEITTTRYYAEGTGVDTEHEAGKTAAGYDYTIDTTRNRAYAVDLENGREAFTEQGGMTIRTQVPATGYDVTTYPTYNGSTVIKGDGIELSYSQSDVESGYQDKAIIRGDVTRIIQKDNGYYYLTKIQGSRIYLAQYSDPSLHYNLYGIASTEIKPGSVVAKVVGSTGTKSRIVKTPTYNTRLLYCYETPSPTFGDIGEGQTDESGVCEVWLDDIFAETIDTEIKYQVFLQMYSEGSLRVTERNPMYFRVEGTPNASFGWELKAIQRDYENMRLEEYEKDDELPGGNEMYSTYDYLETLLYDVEGEEVA